MNGKDISLKAQMLLDLNSLLAYVVMWGYIIFWFQNRIKISHTSSPSKQCAASILQSYVHTVQQVLKYADIAERKIIQLHARSQYEEYQAKTCQGLQNKPHQCPFFPPYFPNLVLTTNAYESDNKIINTQNFYPSIHKPNHDKTMCKPQKIK